MGVKFNLDMILWDFCGNDTSNRSLGFFILLLLSSTIYSGHFCSIISRPAPSNLIWITFKNEVRRLTLIWKSDIPKESYNSNTQTDHHYKPLCNNTNGSVSTQSCQRDTSIRLIRMVILFDLVLYKRKKNSIPFVFPILFLSFLLICHEVWPELLFICRPGWSFFHSCRFLHGLCVSMPVCPCNIFAQRRNTGGLRLWRTHGMEALLSSSVSGQYTDGLMLLVSDGCAFYLFKNGMKEKWLLNILQQQQESYLALVTYRL